MQHQKFACLECAPAAPAHFFRGVPERESLGRKFREPFWVEASGCVCAADRPPGGSCLVQTRTARFRSQLGSNKAVFLRWLGQNR